MPRIYDSANNPLDFCRRHFPKWDAAEAEYGDAGKTGEGPDGRGNCFGYEAEHPPYDGEDYDCAVCHERLTGEDD